MRELVFLACLTIFFGCELDRKRLPVEFSDPFLQSFRNRNIKYVIVESDSTLSPDTMELDKSGNVTKIKSHFFTIRRSYDADDFLVREWHHEDFITNQIARYSWRGDTLLQSWRDLKSKDWAQGGDTSSSRAWTVQFVVQQDGRVIEEKDPSLNSKTRYIYADGKLVRKDQYTLHPHQQTNTWVYDYNDKSNIRRITFFRGTEEWEVYYFTNGLPDSATIKHLTSDESKQKYKYAYY